MEGEVVEAGERILDQAGIPTFAYPDTAAQMFTAMWRPYYNLQAIYKTPTMSSGGEVVNSARERVEGIITTARNEGWTILTEAESKQILAAYSIARLTRSPFSARRTSYRAWSRYPR
jgi:acetyltransferase